MKQNLFELSVTVPSSRGSTKIPEYGHNGLTFVEGRKGQPYTIKLHNNSAHRVLAVAETPLGAHPGGLFARDVPVDPYGEDLEFWAEARAAWPSDWERCWASRRRRSCSS